MEPLPKSVFIPEASELIEYLSCAVNTGVRLCARACCKNSCHEAEASDPGQLHCSCTPEKFTAIFVRNLFLLPN